LLGVGLHKGDRVGVLAYNCVEWMELYVALARAGLIAVPINFRLVGSEIQYIVQHCEIRACVVQENLVNAVAPICEQLNLPERRMIHFGDGVTPSGWSSYESLIEESSAALRRQQARRTFGR
jgi:acyl-CoA synthetase (AMP-forming)/AMP-acid ligase II